MPDTGARRVDPSRLRRNVPPPREEEPEPSTQPVSAGPVDRVIELAVNPTRDKIREVTSIDRMQGRLFPLLDMINTGRQYILEVAMYRQDPAAYRAKFKRARPVPPDLLDEFMYRSAQWQKSVAGKNLERATDIALAEMEARATEEDGLKGADAWED